MRRALRRGFALIFAASVGACAPTTPNVDLTYTTQEKFDTDLADCRAYAEQGHSVFSNILAGGAYYAALGAGAMAQGAQKPSEALAGALVGGVVGGVFGLVVGAFIPPGNTQILRNCLEGRGYTLDGAMAPSPFAPAETTPEVD